MNEIVKEAKEAVEKGLPCGFLVPQLLEVLERQNSEIDILIRKKETLRDELAEKDAEIERLMPFGCQVEVSKKIEKEIKSEAYREFADKLIDDINKDISLYGNCTVHNMALKINNTLKELTKKNDKG